MNTLRLLNELRSTLTNQRENGMTIGLVPTMGNLHAGHIHLVEQACRQADFVVCTIFVNPMQFGENEDLDTYPRTFEEDCEKLSAAGCNLVFAPTVSEVYPNGIDAQTLVRVPEISERHCGTSRPGHFEGVSTVVCKLFNMVQPDVAHFGLKDYQQFMVISRMVEDLCIPVRLVGEATQRDSHGLALSSRNGYLTQEQAQRAPTLYKALQDAQASLEAGLSLIQVTDQANAQLTSQGFDLDYFNISHAYSLEPATDVDNELVILVAAKLGTTRLIDNIRVSVNR
jgi:pantoate--beta-alanine ligase